MHIIKNTCRWDQLPAQIILRTQSNFQESNEMAINTDNMSPTLLIIYL